MARLQSGLEEHRASYTRGHHRCRTGLPLRGGRKERAMEADLSHNRNHDEPWGLDAQVLTFGSNRYGDRVSRSRRAPNQSQPLEENWGLVRQVMMGMMDLGPEQRKESRRIVEGELDWFDGLLSDGRRFLLGERFSRADMTAASLLAPLALPKEHPTYGMLDLPPLARADLARWSLRPAMAWVREIYSAHRAL